MTDKQPNALKLFQFQMLIKCGDILLQWHQLFINWILNILLSISLI